MKVILSIDTAANSGWCITTDGAYYASGEVHCYGHGPFNICKMALALSDRARIVLEQSSHGTRKVLQGLGAARGAWLQAWTMANGTTEPTRFTSVFPKTWRGKVFSNAGNFPLQEKLHAQIVSKKEHVGSDEAAAVCISTWAAQAALK